MRSRFPFLFLCFEDAARCYQLPQILVRLPVLPKLPVLIALDDRHERRVKRLLLQENLENYLLLLALVLLECV